MSEQNKDIHAYAEVRVSVGIKSEVAFYEGMQGRVEGFSVDAEGRDCLIVHLYGLRGTVTLYPNEVIKL